MSSGSMSTAPAQGNGAARRAALAQEAEQFLLVALALVLPFELPLFRVGPLQLTTVEVVLYATVALWCSRLALRPQESVRSAIGAVRSDPWVQVALAWIAVTFASACAAPSYQGPAFKFALRSLSGVLIFFAARATRGRPEATWRRVVWALVAGALLSAATAWVDSWFPRSDALWRAFRESSFSTFGLRRASGVFAYPTIGAMYWEAAVPLVVAAPLLRPVAGVRAGRRAVAFTVAASAVLIGAILASATRSGLAGVLAGVITLLAFGRPAGPWLRRSAAGAGAVLAVAWLLAMDATHLLGQRLRWWHDDSWLRARYEVETPPPALVTREVFEMRLRIRNTGTLAWRSDAEQPTHLAYHWQPSNGKASFDDFEGWRTELPGEIQPGTTFEMWGKARAPDKEGSYVLRWDLVREGVSWFSECGNPTADVAVDVRPGVENAVAPGPSQPAQVANPLPPPRPALWRAARILWLERPLLGVGPDNFRRRYESILSPSPNGLPYRDTRIHANNWYFETLADMGLAGIAALAWMAFVLARSIRRRLAAGDVAGIGVGLAAALFFVHGALDYFLEFTPLYGLFWLLAGLTSAREARSLPDGSA